MPISAGRAVLRAGDAVTRAGFDAERTRLLHEIVRLEPVVGHVCRRAAEAFTIEHDGTTTTIPACARIDLDLRAANAPSGAPARSSTTSSYRSSAASRRGTTTSCGSRPSGSATILRPGTRWCRSRCSDPSSLVDASTRTTQDRAAGALEHRPPLVTRATLLGWPAAHHGRVVRALAATLAATVLVAMGLAVAGSLPEVLDVHLDDFVTDRMRVWDTPGLALALVHDGTTSVGRGYGFADREAQRPMTADTPVVLGSTTKAFTALAVMQLVERGLIDLDASVTRYLPWFTTPEGFEDRITVRHLMSHSAGYPWGILFTDRPYPARMEDYVRWLGQVRLASPPGERFGYSNDTFVVLGLIIEQVTGTSYEAYMAANVLGPLRMTRATFDVDVARERGLARGYRVAVRSAEPFDVPFVPSERPAGTLTTSAAELGHYLRMLLAGGRFEERVLVTEASLRTMWTPVVPVDATGLRYGLAWYLDSVAGMQLLWHLGSVRNSGSHIVLVPEASLAVGVLSNASRPLDPRREVAESIAAAALLFGEAPLEPPAIGILVRVRPTDALLRTVPGVYASAAGPVTVTNRDGALVGSVHGQAFELESAGGTTFLVRSDAERLDGLELEFQAADPASGDPIAASDRLALMGLWFAFRTE
jgi:CubicO group peptidase (beta-lactamase class C family)